MHYEPRQRRMNWKAVAALLVFLVVVVSWMVNAFLKDDPQEQRKTTICGFSEEESLEKLNKTYKNIIQVKDYLYYGESLALYQDVYSPENKDTLSGNTVELRNVCTGEKISMTMENYVDQKIHLDELKEGFYEVYIIEDLIEKRVVFDQPLEENSYTGIKRNNEVSKVSLIADENLIKEYGTTLNQNYLFLNVTKQKPSSNDIDVLIDPYGMNMDLTWLPDEGYKENGLVENKEMYEAAVMLKEELESYGLRVGITKENVDEEGKAYGEDGRLAKGYKQNARYYLFLRFNSNPLSTDIRGFEVHNSYYSSKTLARNIVYRMEKELNMEMSPMYTSANDPGIVTSYLMKSDVDQKQIYDSNLYLRESGGRATLAGRYSETSIEQNKSFVNANGMQGLEIDFGYISNKEDAQYWKDNKEKIIHTLADAFAEGINVSK